MFLKKLEQLPPRIPSQPGLYAAAARIPGPPRSTTEEVVGRVRGHSTAAHTGTAPITTAPRSPRSSSTWPSISRPSGPTRWARWKPPSATTRSDVRQ
ncbi:hypothetical protein QE152_g4363 [Popillia japonica]|uniref:Uncharacterized protein n=1 Tax=Popillia japonica TaxID=7064 RepID=A0AAW1N118_POPJA